MHDLKHVKLILSASSSCDGVMHTARAEDMNQVGSSSLTGVIIAGITAGVSVLVVVVIIIIIL